MKATQDGRRCQPEADPRTINHGEQICAKPYRRQPVTYFCPQSGIGRAMQAQEGPPRRIGILGLGCGTLAAYGRPGDTLRIYEINPLVLDIARHANSHTFATRRPESKSRWETPAWSWSRSPASSSIFW